MGEEGEEVGTLYKHTSVPHIVAYIQKKLLKITNSPVSVRIVS